MIIVYRTTKAIVTKITLLNHFWGDT
jgi:hypothetical protein